MSQAPRSFVAAIAVAIAIAPWALPACHREAGTARDGGPDLGGEDGPPPIALAIAITGCRTYSVDSSGGHCTATAPVALALSPVGSPDFVRFTWSLGDGTPDLENRTPRHVYALPGSYTIILTGVLGSIGTVQTSAAISVEAVPVGGPCDVEAQCGGGLSCACAPGTGCGPAFLRGVCSTPCDTGACPTGGACAFVSLAPPPAAGGLVRGASCLGACGAGCPDGFTCEALPAAGPSAGDVWALSCLPIGALADVGAPCRNASGDPDDDACATGLCADLGALGTCSAPCDAGQPCPTGSVCGNLADGRWLCLGDCADPGACMRDPLLACAAPSPSGGGFQADASAGLTFCAPRACTSDADCAPAGRCSSTGACVRR